MKRNDVPRLFDLLEQLYQGKRRPRDEVTVAIWAEVLKPWPYEQVRDAVVRRARENRFFPDPSEIVEYLPKLQVEEAPPEEEQPTQSGVRSVAWAKRYTERLGEELDRLGLPRFAGNTGAEFQEWYAMCEAAGVEFDQLLTLTHREAYGK